MGDSESDTPAFLDIAPTLDPDRDELGCTFAITNNGLRKLYRTRFDRTAQQDHARVCGIAQRRQRGTAGRDKHKAVIGRRIAVDRRAIERNVGDFAHDLLQQCRIHGRIGGHEREHCGHIRMNHPRALGNAGDGDVHTVDHDSSRHAFGNGIGSHDGIGGGEPAIRADCGIRGRQSCNDAIDGQRLHDHARGIRQHFFGRAFEHPRHSYAFGVRIRQTRFARSGVRVAGIDDQCAKAAASTMLPLQMVTANDHRCRAETIAGEYARCHCAGITHYEQYIVAGPRLYPG